tara:strand:+ start:3971 stop:4405 length:435 start_codon:yes stop_codon:yes gene_type:complete
MNEPFNIPIPEHISLVPGFDISAVPTSQPHIIAEGAVATSSFIKVDVTARGTNRFYPGEGMLTVAILFGYTNGEVYIGKVDGKIDSWMYIIGPYTDTILRVELIEKCEDPEYTGVNLVIWSKEMGEVPFYELLVVPISEIHGHA